MRWCAWIRRPCTWPAPSARTPACCCPRPGTGGGGRKNSAFRGTRVSRPSPSRKRGNGASRSRNCEPGWLRGSGLQAETDLLAKHLLRVPQVVPRCAIFEVARRHFPQLARIAVVQQELVDL